MSPVRTALLTALALAAFAGNSLLCRAALRDTPIDAASFRRSASRHAVWYTALKGLKATSAATVQLSVPVLTGLAGVVLLAEPLTTRILLASAAVLGGIALVIFVRPGPPAEAVKP